MPTICVVPYDPNWPMVFEGLRDRVWPAVSEYALRIEHVGSTSVPGLAAKPIIDMTIVARDTDMVSSAIKSLAKLGYDHRGDLGVVGREAFYNPPGLPAHHLYLCPEGALALRNHVSIRDLLRSDSLVAKGYGELKLALAQQHPEDIDAYIAGKTPMLLTLLERSGLADDERSEIEAINTKPTK